MLLFKQFCFKYHFLFLLLISNQFSEKCLIYISTWNLLTFLYHTWFFVCFVRIMNKHQLLVLFPTYNSQINSLSFQNYTFLFILKVNNNLLRKTLISAVDFDMDFVNRFQRKKKNNKSTTNKKVGLWQWGPQQRFS